jgi:hypothetical protein
MAGSVELGAIPARICAVAVARRLNTGSSASAVSVTTNAMTSAPPSLCKVGKNANRAGKRQRALIPSRVSS